uniref:Major facilitator superfamily (MFS) profile domain-containing protein n=1 Tax=Fundulus heteroclitus TaxID=8078 RepID=A0A3Q2QCT2_FUNHE
MLTLVVKIKLLSSHFITDSCRRVSFQNWNIFSNFMCFYKRFRQQAYKVSLAGSLFFTGLLLGNVLFGPLSDKIGRRPVYLTGLFFEVIFGYVTALAPSYEVFAASRLLVGLMNGGIGLVCFVLAQEYVGKPYWAMTGTSMIFAVGIALFGALGYLVRPWRTLALVANSSGVLVFLLSV